MRLTAVTLASILAAGVAISVSASGANAAERFDAPCAKLTAGEVRFPPLGASRVVFVIASERAQNTVLITGCVRTGNGFSQEWQTTGFIGKNGFAAPGELREGVFQSPTGSFSVTEALGKSNPGTTLDYHAINPSSRWGGPGSPSYNTYTENGTATDENLWYWMNEGTYEQAAVINYNRPPDSPAIAGADYAIFFGAGSKVSAGCVSTDLATSTRVVKDLSPGDRFIMGAVSDVFLPEQVTPEPAPAPVPTASLTPFPSETPQALPPQASEQIGIDRATSFPLGIMLTLLGTAMVVWALVWLGRDRKRE